MLNRWNAVSFRDVLVNGRTKPLIVECIESISGIVLDPNSHVAPRRREFVVKAIGNPEVDKGLIFRELLGNLAARKYGLQTPEPGLVYISNNFARAVNPILARDYGFEIFPGIAAGCEFFRGGFSFPPEGTIFTEEELALSSIALRFRSGDAKSRQTAASAQLRDARFAACRVRFRPVFQFSLRHYETWRTLGSVQTWYIG